MEAEKDHLTEKGPIAAPLEWRLPNPKGSYIRSSMIELLPEPLTPLFATLGQEEINESYRRFAAYITGEGVLPDPFFVLINDYGYYDSKFSAGQMLRFAMRAPAMYWWLIKTAETRWREEARPAYAASVDRWSGRDLAALPAVELLRGVRETFSTAMDHYIQGIQAGVLPAAFAGEAAFTWFYDKLVRGADDPPALTFLLGFDSLPIRAEKSLYDLAQWCRERPALAELVSGTAAGQIEAWMSDPSGLPENVPLEEWSEFQARFASHLESFGHAVYDLDFAKPVPADDPTPLLETLRHLVQGQGADPYRRQREALERREEAVRRVDARLRGWRRYWFHRLLGWAQHVVPIREDALGDAGLGWPLLRRMLLELGRRLVAGGAAARPQDVFWLTASEAEELAGQLDAGVTRLPDKSQEVGERRSRIERESRHTPPVALPQRYKFAGVDLTQWLPARTEQKGGDVIKGIGASPGRVTGTARVIHGPDEFGQMEHGDILVAKITTPAWTPLFALAVGVVTDVGGPLSHSSIVAREYGIPAVLGTGVATERLRSGESITVDGGAGVVMVGEAGTADAETAVASRLGFGLRISPRVAVLAAALASFAVWRARKGRKR